MAAPLVRLNSGHSMPLVGLGTYDGGANPQNPPGTVARTVEFAVAECGVRMLDCAFSYLNEAEVGDGLQSVLQRGTIPREQLFVISKLANNYHRKEHVEMALRKSLTDLQLEYVDLYLMHWPLAFKFIPFDVTRRGFEKGFNPHCMMPDPPVTHPMLTDPRHDRVPIRETWEAMEALVDKGLARSIGVANFTPALLHDLLTYARIPPAVVQVEVHPFCAQGTLHDYLKKLGIQLMAYAPLGYGQFKLSGERTLLQDVTLAQVGNRHGKSPAQVVLRWHLQRGVAAIPKTVVPSELRQNMQIFDFELSADDMEAISSLDINFHYVRPSDPGWYEVPLW
eukprot:RCo031737